VSRGTSEGGGVVTSQGDDYRGARGITAEVVASGKKGEKTNGKRDQSVDK